MTEESKEGKKPVRAGVIVLTALAAASVLYLTGRELLSWSDLCLQMRVAVPGEVLTFLVTPVCFLAFVVTAALRMRGHTGRGMRAVGFVICALAVFAGFLYLTAGSLIYVLFRSGEMERDRWAGEDNIWIESAGEENVGLESWRVYRYYEPVGRILKRPCETLSEVMEWRAYRKYGETFVVTEQDRIREKDESLSVYTLYLESDPELTIHMLSGDSFYGFLDDYPQALANRLFSADQEFCRIAVFEKTGTAADQTETLLSCFAGAPVIVIDSEADGGQKAGTVARAIGRAMDHPLFYVEGNEAEVVLRICFPDGETQDMRLPFGNRANRYTNDSINGMIKGDYYTDEAHVNEAIRHWYEAHAAEMPDMQELQGTTDGSGDAGAPGTSGNETGTTGGSGDAGAPGASGDGTGTGDPETFANAGPDTVEGAYLSLYREVFEPEGARYECSYNAKGNFYAVLSEGRGRPAADQPEMDTKTTIVYDRESKNGECHLFVCYETYYDEYGSEYTTAIRNTYAVNRSTGEVTASGKRAWEDVGSQEYQEAAGEK